MNRLIIWTTGTIFRLASDLRAYAPRVELGQNLGIFKMLIYFSDFCIYLTNYLSESILNFWQLLPFIAGFHSTASDAWLHLISVYGGAQWLSGRVLDSRPRGRGFEPHRRHCIVSLGKNINPSLVRVQPTKTHPFITERLLMGRRESNQTKKKNVCMRSRKYLSY